MLRAEDVCEGEWAEWYLLPALVRWQQSMQMLEAFLAMGGSLDPEPDTQSPFFDAEAPGPGPPDGRAGLRFLRRGGV
jgi:hypothetical protein